MRGVRGVAVEAIIGASKGVHQPGALAWWWHWIMEWARGHR